MYCPAQIHVHVHVYVHTCRNDVIIRRYTCTIHVISVKFVRLNSKMAVVQINKRKRFNPAWKSVRFTCFTCRKHVATIMHHSQTCLIRTPVLIIEVSSLYRYNKIKFTCNGITTDCDYSGVLISQDAIFKWVGQYMPCNILKYPKTGGLAV